MNVLKRYKAGSWCHCERSKQIIVRWNGGRRMHSQSSRERSAWRMQNTKWLWDRSNQRSPKGTTCLLNTSFTLLVQKMSSLRSCRAVTLLAWTWWKNTNSKQLLSAAFQPEYTAIQMIRLQKWLFNTVVDWMKSNPDVLNRVIFCTFLPLDFKLYTELMAEYNHKF